MVLSFLKLQPDRPGESRYSSYCNNDDQYHVSVGVLMFVFLPGMEYKGRKGLTRFPLKGARKCVKTGVSSTPGLRTVAVMGHV